MNEKNVQEQQLEKLKSLRKEVATLSGEIADTLDLFEPKNPGYHYILKSRDTLTELALLIQACISTVHTSKMGRPTPMES